MPKVGVFCRHIRPHHFYMLSLLLEHVHVSWHTAFAQEKSLLAWERFDGNCHRIGSIGPVRSLLDFWTQKPFPTSGRIHAQKRCGSPLQGLGRCFDHKNSFGSSFVCTVALGGFATRRRPKTCGRKHISACRAKLA